MVENVQFYLVKDFRNSGGMTLVFEDRIEFRKNVILSWDTMVIDSEFHAMYDLINNTNLRLQSQ